MIPFVSNNTLLMRQVNSGPTTTTLPPNILRLTSLGVEALSYKNNNDDLIISTVQNDVLSYEPETNAIINSTLQTDVLTQQNISNDISISNVILDVLQTDYL